ncbi:MAG: hypothetical protein R3E79_21330 [Caldilineaceae bacterium]
MDDIVHCLSSADETRTDARWLLPNPKSGRPMRKEAAALGPISKMRYTTRSQPGLHAVWLAGVRGRAPARCSLHRQAALFDCVNRIVPYTVWVVKSVLDCSPRHAARLFCVILATIHSSVVEGMAFGGCPQGASFFMVTSFLLQVSVPYFINVVHILTFPWLGRLPNDCSNRVGIIVDALADKYWLDFFNQSSGFLFVHQNEPFVLSRSKEVMIDIASRPISSRIIGLANFFPTRFANPRIRVTLGATHTDQHLLFTKQHCFVK